MTAWFSSVLLTSFMLQLIYGELDGVLQPSLQPIGSSQASHGLFSSCDSLACFPLLHCLCQASCTMAVGSIFKVFGMA